MRKFATGRFSRATDGAAAVEFAMIALPFFWLLIALVEVTLIAFAQSSLDQAVAETGRRIRVGEIQRTGVSEAQMRTTICDEMGQFVVVDCGRLNLDVDAFQSFVNVQNPNPILPNGALNTGDFGFQPGAPSDIVLVRAFYEWRVITPLFQSLIANVGGESRLLSSTMLFRNEPFEP